MGDFIKRLRELGVVQDINANQGIGEVEEDIGRALSA